MSDASVTLGLDAREFDARLAALEGKIQSVGKTAGSSFGGLGSAMSGLAGFFSVGAIAAGLKGVVEYGAHVQDLSNRFGVSTDAIQHFGNAAEKNGSSLESVAMGFNKLAIARSRALEGQQAIVEAFRRLGISIQDIQKLDPEQLMMKIGKSSMDAASMVKLLGRNSLELRPTLAGLADGAIQFSDAINKVDLEKLKAASDAWKTLGQQLTIASGGIIAKTPGAFEGLWSDVKTLGTKAWATVTAAAKGHFKEVAAGLKDQKNFWSEFYEPGSYKSRHPSASGMPDLLKRPQDDLKPKPAAKGKRQFDTEDDAIQIALDDLKEKSRLSLSELAGRDAFGEGATYKNKYIGGDIYKAQEAMREKALAEDFAFKDQDEQAKFHMGRFTQLTGGISSLQEKDRGLGGITEKVNSIEKSAQAIVENTKKQFVNH